MSPRSDRRLPGVDIVVFCTDAWAHCIHDPAPGNLSRWQLPAASLIAYCPGPQGTTSPKVTSLQKTAGNGRLMQGYKGLVARPQFGTIPRAISAPELPIGSAEVSVTTILWVSFFLSPFLLPHFLTGVFPKRSPPQNLHATLLFSVFKGIDCSRIVP